MGWFLLKISNKRIEVVVFRALFANNGIEIVVAIIEIVFFAIETKYNGAKDVAKPREHIKSHGKNTEPSDRGYFQNCINCIPIKKDFNKLKEIGQPPTAVLRYAGSLLHW